jgi:hypothetical protein
MRRLFHAREAMAKKKNKWKIVGPDEMVMQRYPCGVMAGESLRLRRDLVITDHRNRPTGVVHRAGEIWGVLTGIPSEPKVVWLREPDGNRHTWTDDELLEWLERLPSQTSSN